MVKVKASLDGCTKEHKCQLKELLQAYKEVVVLHLLAIHTTEVSKHKYKEVFEEPKGLPPKREVEHEIQLLLDSPFPNIGLYRKFILEEYEVKK